MEIKVTNVIIELNDEKEIEALSDMMSFMLAMNNKEKFMNVYEEKVAKNLYERLKDNYD